MKGNARVDTGLLILRLGLGLIMLYAGSQKMLGLFGGPGYAATLSMFTTKMGINPVFANLAIAAEFFGGLGVLFGCLTQIAAFGIACTMAYAMFKVTAGSTLLSDVFQGSKDPTAMMRLFFPASLFMMAVSVMILGAGAYSIDAKMFGKKKSLR